MCFDAEKRSDVVAAANYAEADKTAVFASREEELDVRAGVRDGRDWTRSFQFCPFGVDVFGSLFPSAISVIDHYAKLRAA